MDRVRKDFTSALFKPVAGGWVYRSPNPWVFGDAPHYLVTDTQRAQLEAVLVPKKPALVGVLIIPGVLVWVVVVATLVWAFGSGQDNPTMKDLIAMSALIIVPVLGLVPLFGWIQRRRVEPILAAAALTNERITNAELRQQVQSRQSLNACISSVFAFNAMVGAAIVHLESRHNYQASFWAFLALVFGLLAIRWYRLVLQKAGKQ